MDSSSSFSMFRRSLATSLDRTRPRMLIMNHILLGPANNARIDGR